MELWSWPTVVDHDVYLNIDINSMNPQLRMRLFGLVALLGCVFVCFTLIVQLSPRYGTLRYLSALGRGKVNQEPIEDTNFQNEVF